MCLSACFHDGQCDSRLGNLRGVLSHVPTLELAVHVRVSRHTGVTKHSTVANCDDSKNVKVRAKREYPDGMPRPCHGGVFTSTDVTLVRIA